MTLWIFQFDGSSISYALPLENVFSTTNGPSRFGSSSGVSRPGHLIVLEIHVDLVFRLQAQRCAFGVHLSFDGHLGESDCVCGLRSKYLSIWLGDPSSRGQAECSAAGAFKDVGRSSNAVGYPNSSSHLKENGQIA